MKKGIFVLLMGLPLFAFSMGRKLPDPQTVAHVDLVRYLGVWYEIASFPQSFQKDCVATQATYSLLPDGKIQVDNSCRDKTLEGKLRVAKGTAKVVDTETNAKLNVSFFWPFWGDYWILDLGEDYEYALVGSPNREYLWILSRTRKMDGALYDRIVKVAEEKGFDTAKFSKTLQPSE